MEKVALLVSGIIFLVVSILHLARYLMKLEVKVGTWIAPLWLSLIGFLFAGSMSLWIFTLIR